MSDGTIDRRASISSFASPDYSPADLWQQMVGFHKELGGTVFYWAPTHHGFLSPYDTGEVVLLMRPTKAAPSAPPVERTRPAWRDSVSDQIADLCALKPNWDGRNGLKPLVRPLRVVELVLQAVMTDDSRAPWVVPTSDRGVDLEWKLGDSASVIISIPPDDEIEVVVDDPAAGVDVDGGLEDLGAVREFLQRHPIGGA